MDVLVPNILLKIGALKFAPHRPFTYASGLKGPLYCDNRLLLAYPNERQQVVTALKNLLGDWRPQAIMAMATAAIAHGAWLAQELSLPLGYIRNAPKDHGTQKQIEGFRKKGATVVLVEDLINQGSGLTSALAHLEGYFNLLGVLSIVNYDMPATKHLLSQRKVTIKSLVNFEGLLKVAIEGHFINEDERQILQKWQQNPLG